MNRPIIAAIGVSHRDVELATLWLKWTSYLSTQPGCEHEFDLLVCFTQRVNYTQNDALLAALKGCEERRIRVLSVELADSEESGYPKSASHLFLRTLEMAAICWPRHAVLWCEADTVPMKPSWFAEIAAEYQTCENPFLGVTVGTRHKQMSGIGVYPPDWRARSPKLANVLNAPDQAQWGPGKGMPWDVAARDEVYPQMAESRLMTNIWKNRDVRATRLKDVPRRTVLFHQDKTGALIREIATAHYPEFMSTISQPRRFFFMNGHPSRLMAKGLQVKFSYTKFASGYHRSAVCSDELSEEHASALATLVGQLGVREIDEAEFLRVTGRTVKSLPAPRARSTPVALPESAKHSHPHVYVMLGRYGDVMNVLPMLKADADAGHRPTLVVSKDFADILDGVSYCDRIVWDGAYDQLPEALRWLRRDKGIVAPVIAQYHRNPFDKARLTPSYQTECWRLAGRLDKFASRGPLVFDQRDENREATLSMRVVGGIPKPLILVGLESVSSPLKNADEILRAIVGQFGETHEIVNLATVKADRIYDLIGLFDRAAALVTADTSFLHLARASEVPVVALLNDGWRGSAVGPKTTALRYAEATPQRVTGETKMALAHFTLEKLELGEDIRVREVSLSEVHMTISPGMAAAARAAYPEMKFEPANVYHVVDPHGSDARHHVAQASWFEAYADGMIPAHFRGGQRTAKTELKDPRDLPFLKDVLWSAIPEDARQCGGDIIVWTNSDVGFAPGATAFIRDYVSKHHAATMRRTESNGQGHPGRDLFAFTIDWLLEHFEEMPDFVLGAPVFDLGIVAMVRRFHKLPTLTLKNLAEDMAPADMPPGYALHKSHEPEWQVRNMNMVPSNIWNKRVFKQWAAKYCPEIRFSPGGNIK